MPLPTGSLAAFLHSLIGMFLGVHGKFNDSGSYLISVLVGLHRKTDSPGRNLFGTPFSNMARDLKYPAMVSF